MKIGFLGPEGTFSEEASKLYLRKIKGKVDLIPFSTFHDLLFAVDSGKLAEGIVPIENSIEGTIGIVTDMLVKDVNLMIEDCLSLETESSETVIGLGEGVNEFSQVEESSDVLFWIILVGGLVIFLLLLIFLAYVFL